MTRRHARFALLYWVPIWLVASQTVGPGPLVFFEQPIHFVLLYLGPPVALVLLVLSFVGPKARPRVRPRFGAEPRGGRGTGPVTRAGRAPAH